MHTILPLTVSQFKGLYNFYYHACTKIQTSTQEVSRSQEINSLESRATFRNVFKWLSHMYIVIFGKTKILDVIVVLNAN